MATSLRYKAFEVESGVSVEVEVPGYSREDISVEVKPYTLNTFGIPVEVKGLFVSAENTARGKADLILQLTTAHKFKLDDVSAKVNNGLLEITLPYGKKYQNVIVPVT